MSPWGYLPIAIKDFNQLETEKSKPISLDKEIQIKTRQVQFPISVLLTSLSQAKTYCAYMTGSHLHGVCWQCLDAVITPHQC